jgi:hypothetical protein
MATQPTPLTANSSIGSWLQHPEGGQLIRELLAQGGFDESSLAPVRELPLQQLVAMSQGQLPQSVVDDLVLRANGGVAPEDAEEDVGWRERITPGRFTGKTVIVTGAASGIGRATAARIAREGRPGHRARHLWRPPERLRRIAAGRRGHGRHRRHHEAGRHRPDRGGS